MAKLRWRDETPKPVEQLPCLVIKNTPDGVAVGVGLSSEDSVKWSTPIQVEEHIVSRPKDAIVTAEKWANDDGTVTLKPKRVNRGAPTPTNVGWKVVFGEALDTALKLRLKREIEKLTHALIKGRRTYWRHLCEAQKRSGPTGSEPTLPLLARIPLGEACAHCGAAEPKPKTEAA